MRPRRATICPITTLLTGLCGLLAALTAPVRQAPAALAIPAPDALAAGQDLPRPAADDLPRPAADDPGSGGAGSIAAAAEAPAPAAASQPASPPPASPPPGVSTTAANLYRLVKRLDFDERKLGNFEDSPMYWTRLAGPGLPYFNRGRFDEAVGDAAPPSFRLDVTGGGSLAYEYEDRDLIAIAGSDYVIVGKGRTQDVDAARAFVVAYFVDRYDQEIPGSKRVSNLLHGADGEAWQTFRIDLPGDYPEAYALRIQLWLLQNHVWREREPAEPDPIIEHDVLATAWFDDVTVYRLPRTRLRFSHPGGLVLPGKREACLIEVQNATPYPLDAELIVRDAAGQVVHKQRMELPADTDRTGRPAIESSSAGGELKLASASLAGAAAVRAELPELPPGIYDARFVLLVGDEALQERDLRFAVLSELPAGEPFGTDLGVDLGPWRRDAPPGVRELLTALHCGAVKIGVPMIGALTDQEKLRYFNNFAEMIRELNQIRIDTVAVILSPDAAIHPDSGRPTSVLLDEDPAIWQPQFSPVLANFGGLLSTWQVGDESIELRPHTSWSERKLSTLREHLGRFVTLPQLVVPALATSPPPPELAEPATVLLEPAVPAWAVSDQLAALADAQGDRWVRIVPDDSTLLGAQQLVDTARRVILARAADVDRVYVPAPFKLSTSGGDPGWQPSEEYIALRTIFHLLAGKRLVDTLGSNETVQALLFDGPSSSCMVVWTRRTGPDAPIDLYLGAGAQAIDLRGRPVELETRDGKTRVVPRPEPIFISGVDTALARFGASVTIEPTQIAINAEKPRPVLRMTNFYREPLVAEVTMIAPESWEIEPPAMKLTLQPGQTLSQALRLTLPPRQLAMKRSIELRVNVVTPHPAALSFHVPITIGLPDIFIDVSAFWDGDRLIVEQALRNQTEESVSFSAFCQPEGRPLAEGAFLDVAPGERAVQTFVFPSARSLAGSSIYLGISEIDGSRRLDQLVDVPE